MSDIEMKAKFRDWFTTKAPKQFKEMFDKTTADEGILLEVCFHQFAEMVANDVRSSEKQCNLPVVSQRNFKMTDMNNIEIKAGHKIMYQKGQKYEVTCDVVDRNGELWLTNWSDKNEDILVADFWHEPSDRKITEVLNPNYGG